MTRTYERKFLDDGITPNPKFKPDTRKEDRHKDKGDRHKTNSNRHSSRARKKFLAFDGEGISVYEIVGYSTTKRGERIPIYKHLYVLLMAGSGEYIINEHGLSTVECFDFLLDQAQKYPDTIKVYYGLSYDTNKMLKDVPYDVLKSLYEGNVNGRGANTVYYHGSNGFTYKLTYYPRRSFTISRIEKKPYNYTLKIAKSRHGVRYQKYTTNNKISVTLWDVSGFFQKRFVDALGNEEVGYFHEYVREELVDGDLHEIIEFPDGLRIDLTQMKTMKDRRGSFTFEQLEQEIMPYCLDEVQSLQKLMERLRECLEKANLLPFQSRWHGVGACATTLLHRYHVKESMNECILDPEIKNAQLHAYSAGRFELGKYGIYIGKVYNYDLRSAFPSVMPELPCLTDGMWRHVRGAPSRPYSIIHVRWQLSGSPFYPFFFRTPEGSIYYPDGSEIAAGDGLEGWYWKHEVDAALKALAEGKLKGKIEVLESWEFQPYHDTKPLAFMNEVYETRKRWQSEGNPAHKELKFTIASIYGKFIQSLGWTFDDDGKLKEPSYHNIGYAGYITASVRAKLFEAIMQAPDQIVSVVADGLYSLVKLDLPIGDNMGQWKVNECDGIIMVGPGIYWSLIKLGREPNEQERNSEYFESKYLYHNNEWYYASPHYQGFDRGKLVPSDVLRRWSNKKLYSTIMSRATRFITLASAIVSDDLWDYWGCWRTIERELYIHPQFKRKVSKLSTMETHPGKGLEDTVAAPMLLIPNKMSSKFKRAWEEEEDDSYGLVDGVEHKIFINEHLESNL